jgi:hypothetical protein
MTRPWSQLREHHRVLSLGPRPLFCSASRSAAQSAALVVVLAGVVHYPAAPSSAQSATGQSLPVAAPLTPAAKGIAPALTVTNESLPPNVAAVRQTLIDVARSGRIDDLITALDSQERGVNFSGADGARAVTDWKALSADGDGRSVLAEMANLLMLEPTVIHAGPDKENNQLFVWPYLVDRKLEALTPGEDVDLLRLVPAADARAMKVKKTWTWWRLAIGADGIWHMFKKGN